MGFTSYFRLDIIQNIQTKIEKRIYKGYLFLYIVVIAICYDLFAVPRGIISNLRSVRVCNSVS